MQLSCPISHRVIRITWIDLKDLFLSDKCIYTWHFFMHNISLSFHKNPHFSWDNTVWAGSLCCVFSHKVKLYSATAMPTCSTIRTWNIKAFGFQRISLTANFRIPGSHVSRQLIKNCFHHHLPIECPKSSPITTGPLLSEKKEKRKKNPDTMSGLL